MRRLHKATFHALLTLLPAGRLIGRTVTGLSVATDRSGKVKIALLFWLIVVGAAGYYGVEVGGVYFRRYQLEEKVTQALGFAGQLTDEAIHQQILDDVAHMNLPPEAQRFRFERTLRPRTLEVSIAYAETVNLLFTTKRFPVSIDINRRF